MGWQQLVTCIFVCHLFLVPEHIWLAKQVFFSECGLMRVRSLGGGGSKNLQFSWNKASRPPTYIFHGPSSQAHQKCKVPWVRLQTPAHGIFLGIPLIYFDLIGAMPNRASELTFFTCYIFPCFCYLTVFKLKLIIVKKHAGKYKLHFVRPPEKLG